MEDQTPKHKLKLTIEVEVGATNVHAAKALLPVIVEKITGEHGESEIFGPITVDVMSVHVSEKMARKVAAPESQPEAESK